MIIRYDLTCEDLWKTYRYMVFREPGMLITYLVLMALIPFVAYFWMAKSLGSKMYALLFALVILVINIFYFPNAVKRKLVQQVQANSGVLGEHRIELFPEGLKESTSVNDSFYRWDGIHAIRRNQEYLFIYQQHYLIYAITVCLFDSIREADLFYEQLEQYDSAKK